MAASGIQVLAVLLVCVAGKKETAQSFEVKMWRSEEQSVQQHVSQMYKEVETLRKDQALMKQKQEEMNQVIMHCAQMQTSVETDLNMTLQQEGSSLALYPSVYEDNDLEDDGDGARDPCYRYTVLDQPWRATNFSTRKVSCDRYVQWKGWYRLFYHGKTIQMPERCVRKEMCGTHSPLWLVGGHPRIRDGIVTRKVCGNWKNNCCNFKSPPIQVKACRGNYYVYKFVKPPTCHLAYCADVNTLVCGKCKKDEICTSKNKISWFCKKKRRRVKTKVHFFASHPGSLRGKVNRIQFRKVYVNVGRAFNRHTGVFTAPVRGVYQFFFSTQSAVGGTKTDLWLVVNSYWVAMSHTSTSRSNSVGNLSTYMATLRKGSLVYVTHNCGNSWASSASNTITFGGSLLFVPK